MGIGVLGPLTVDGEATSLGPRDRVVLAALATQPGVVLSTERLADVLWGDQPPVSWPKVVQGCVARLRRQLGAAAIETVPHGYRLRVPPDTIDARRFEQQAVRIQELLALGEADRAAFVADEALALWRGRPFVDLENWEEGRIEADRLEQLHADVEERRLEAYLRAGRTTQALADAQATVTAAPLRERRWALLAQAQFQAGRQADALASLRAARAILADKLGVDPGPELVELEQAILRQDPGLLAQVALPEPSATCPYLGLVPYDLDDADIFFGREVDVATCLQRLTRDGVLAVVGPSGSGKSSLVRAGVVSALVRDGRRAFVITPGRHPMDALAAMPAPGQAPVLVVDQCEEVFTLCEDPDERSRFLAALTHHAATAPVVVALRADRLGELSGHADAARLVERGLHLLKAMDEADLRAAIEGPARQAGLLLEGGLVDLMIRDVEGEPGALPLLSHALLQTWERREGRTLTVEGYHAAGGIRGAVAQTAEQLYEQTDPNRQRILRDLLLRLVTPSPDGDPVRSRVPRRLVASDREHEEVIEQLVRARLVTSDEEAVELAHEALARAWPRLQGWLDDDVEGQRLWRHLALAAETWDAMGRPDTELYRGIRLAKARDWHTNTEPDLNPVEQAFLDASQQWADTELAVSRRRRRTLVTGLATGLTVMTLLAATALVAQQRADHQADVARSRELAAAAIGVIDTDPALSKLLAVASATGGIEPTFETVAALHRAYAADRVLHRYAWPEDQTMRSLFADVDPGGGRLAAVADSNHVEVVDIATGERVWSHTFEADPPDTDGLRMGALRFAREGEVLVSAARWEGRPGAPPELAGLHVWSAGTGEPVDRFDLGPCGGQLLGVSVTHAVVRTLRDHPSEVDCNWGARPAVALVDLTTGGLDLLAERSVVDRPPNWGAAISGDGRYVAFDDLTGADDEVWRTVVVDLSTGEPVLDFDHVRGDNRPGVRDLSHDGSFLLYGDQPVQVWDVAAGEVVAAFRGHAGESWFGGAFAPSGTSVYTSARDGTLRQWSATSGEELAVVGSVGHGPVSAVGESLVVIPGKLTGEAVVVDLRPQGELGTVDTCRGFTFAHTLGVGGGLAAFGGLCNQEHLGVSAQMEGTVDVTYVVDLQTLQVLHVVRHHGSQDLAVSPDGTRFVRQESGFDDEGHLVGPLAVRDLRTGDVLVELDGMCVFDGRLFTPADEQPGCAPYPEPPFGFWAGFLIHWSPDGTMVATTNSHPPNGGGELVVWDAHTGELLHAERRQPRRQGTSGVLFTPDSREVIVSSLGDPGTEWDGLRVLSTDTWELLRHVEPPGDPDVPRPTFLGYSPDGSTLLAVTGWGGFGGDAEIHWYDAETLELTRSQRQVHEGSIKHATLSPSRTRLATGSSDGLVRVWDTASGQLLQEMPLFVEQRTSPARQVQGVGFVDDRRLVVAPEHGGLVVVTTDPTELLTIVRRSLTRGFTPIECDRYNFGDDCPSLEQLRDP